MTNQQIKDELRRSACEDIDPYRGCEWVAWGSARDHAEQGVALVDLSKNDLRTFFLLVAEALE